MKIQACLTNKSDLWKTPKKMYDFFINNEWFDPCPTNPTFNGLEIEWKNKNFVNPPYSQITKWIDKALIEAKKGHETIMLIPSRTDTKWFKKLVEHGAEIYFIQGRLKFNDIKQTAPFPSMLVHICKNNLPYLPQMYLLTKELRYWDYETKKQ